MKDSINEIEDIKTWYRRKIAGTRSTIVHAILMLGKNYVIICHPNGVRTNLNDLIYEPKPHPREECEDCKKGIANIVARRMQNPNKWAVTHDEVEPGAGHPNT